MIGLTRRQGRLLAFIRDFTQQRGYAPSVREMMPAVGVRSTSQIVTALEELEEDGFIRRLSNRWRALEVTRPLATVSQLRSVYRTEGEGM